MLFIFTVVHILQAQMYGNVLKSSTQNSSAEESVVSAVILQICSTECDGQVEAGSDAPSESKVDQRVTLPAENGLSHTLIITPKPPALVGPQPQSAGIV